MKHRADMNDTLNITGLVCPEDHSEFENDFTFWVDGVTLCSIAIPGILLNLTAIFIITRNKELHNTSPPHANLISTLTCNTYLGLNFEIV